MGAALFVIVVIALAFWLVPAIFAANIAAEKGRSRGGWLILGLMFGLMALLIAAVVSPKTA